MPDMQQLFTIQSHSQLLNSFASKCSAFIDTTLLVFLVLALVVMIVVDTKGLIFSSRNQNGDCVLATVVPRTGLHAYCPYQLIYPRYLKYRQRRPSNWKSRDF